MKAQDLELWLQESVDLTKNPEITVTDVDGNIFPITVFHGDDEDTLHIDTPTVVPE